jgi:hypothetical protein
MAELHLAEIAKLSLFLFGLAVGWWMVFRRTMAPLFAPAVPPDRRWELDPDPREAHRWLVTQCGALARERFRGPADALRFIDRLYGAGAVSVLVSHVREEPAGTDGEAVLYADSVVVVLPEAAEARRTIFGLAAAEALREGIEPDRDQGQSVLHIWWE